MNKDKQVDVTYFPDGKTAIEEINGTRNVRYFERSTAIVGGKWFAVGFYGLATAAWTGTDWELLVDEKRGEALFGKSDARVDAIATDGTRAWAVSTTGAVHEWTGEWKPLAKSGDPLFEKQRRFTRLAWDRARSRLVLWGGNNGTRSSNDTLLFEGGKWRKSAKPGTKLAFRKADNYWMYDDPALGGVVRVGPDGWHVLDGDAWKVIDRPPPSFVTGNPDDQSAQMIVGTGVVIDPLGGTLYRDGTSIDIGRPPGLVSMAVLKAAGAYFGGDYDRANDRDWMWATDGKRAFGMRLGSSKFVCQLEL